MTNCLTLPPVTAKISTRQFFCESGIAEDPHPSRSRTKKSSSEKRTIAYAKMNISDPVVDAIGRVDFTFLSTAEIRDISVKRIQNDNTFDSLMLPVADGLYDTALGAWGDLP